MTHFKKGVLLLVAAALLLFTVGGVVAKEGDVYRDKGKTDLLVPEEREMCEEKPSFQPITGIVQDIEDAPWVEGVKYVIVETIAGEPVHFVVSENTYFAHNREPVVGDVVTTYYDANLPVIMIYPPQYSAVTMIVEFEGMKKIKVDRFGEHLVSLDGTLKLDITDETEVVRQDGEPFTGDLDNRDLAVYYDVSTKSIPALTTPGKVVVLSEESVQKGFQRTDDEVIDTDLPDLAGMEMVVEDRVIDAPAAYYNRDNTVMVPLRAIAEALGFNVGWHAEKQLVMLGDSFTATIGKDAYVDMGRDNPISLGNAPELVDGRTFVPLSFFREVVPMNNAYVFEAQIVINNREEVMN